MLSATYKRASRLLLLLAATHLAHVACITTIAIERQTMDTTESVIFYSLTLLVLLFIWWISSGVRRGRRIVAGTCIAVLFFVGWIVGVSMGIALGPPPPWWLIAFECYYFCVLLVTLIVMVNTQFRHEAAEARSEADRLMANTDETKSSDM